jgi:polyisoprenoid-binding protein YceI
MKTFVLCLLFLINNSSANRAGYRVNKSTWPVNILKVDVSASSIGWHIAKMTGAHDGTLKVSSGQLILHNHKLNGGMILIDMNTITDTDLAPPDKQKLEANLKGDNFFDTGRFSIARFDITNVAYAMQDTSVVNITGKLFMHGITKRIDFKAKILSGNNTAFIARADLIINRRDWNIATGNFKYDHFINPQIRLHIVLEAS